MAGISTYQKRAEMLERLRLLYHLGTKQARLTISAAAHVLLPLPYGPIITRTKESLSCASIPVGVGL